MNIRKYYTDYVAYFPDEWRWNLKQTDENMELYRRFRMRHMQSPCRDMDKLPSFDSVEKDARQFRLTSAEVVDFFGIHWIGKKGVSHYVGEPDYEQHLYYYDAEFEESVVDYDYTQKNPPEGFAKIGSYDYVDIVNIVDLKYHWILENHLFKDSHITVSYDPKVELHDNEWRHDYPQDADIERIWDITDFAVALLEFGKQELYAKLCQEVDAHFIALRDAHREEERAFWPKKTADEYFREAKAYKDKNKK